MKYFAFIIVLTLFTSCANESKSTLKVDGLWTVKRVKVGDKEMTPIARWMRFNTDSTQTSGNGWLQHSFGTWSLNAENKLSIVNENGIEDSEEPFTVTFENGKMIWHRVEEDNPVEVVLERTDKLPTSEANKLYGLWKLRTIYLDHHIENINSTTLFFRWDNTFVRQIDSVTKFYGVFKTQAHKPELQMIDYAKKENFEFYEFIVSNDTLILTKKKSDFYNKLIYTRIHQFLK